jgi:hypothetical protein
VKVVPPEEVATREHLIISTTADLEDLLFEGKELQLKESIKELEKHLARLREGNQRKNHNVH